MIQAEGAQILRAPAADRAVVAAGAVALAAVVLLFHGNFCLFLCFVLNLLLEKYETNEN